MFALTYISVDDDVVEEELLAVSTSLDALMAHARNDAFGKGCDELTDFEQFGNSHLAYVKMRVDDGSRGKYFIDHVLVV